MEFTKEKCKVCGHEAHFLEPHLERECIGVKAYLDRFPGAPLMSELGRRKYLQATQTKDNEPVIFPIRSTFGLDINGTITQAHGFAKPFPTTPAIDPDYVFRKEILVYILAALDDPDERVLFTGPTGSGKTSAPEQVCARLNLPMTRINMDGDMTRGDLVGEWKLRGGDTYFQYGMLPVAMREGHVLIVDEWDAGSPSVNLVIQAVLDGKPLTITETSEIIHPHPNFRLFATANTVGQGDESGIYNGTQHQNFAQVDRFTIAEFIDYPDRETESAILKKKTGIDNDGAVNKMLSVADKIRTSFKKEECRVTMSTRTLVNIGRKMTKFGDVHRAYNIAFLNKLTSEDKRFASEIIQRIWG